MRIEYITNDGMRFYNKELAEQHERNSLGDLTKIARVAFPNDAYSYQLVVVFDRSIGDDLDIVKDKYPGQPLPDKLIAQLVDELQDGYNQAGIAGSFQVLPQVIGIEKFSE